MGNKLEREEKSAQLIYISHTLYLGKPSPSGWSRDNFIDRGGRYPLLVGVGVYGRLTHPIFRQHANRALLKRNSHTFFDNENGRRVNSVDATKYFATTRLIPGLFYDDLMLIETS